ncbi:MAG: NUDIX hydrolase [Bacteroidota bacterium]
MKTEREIRYRGRVFDLVLEHIRHPSGEVTVREIASHPGGAVAVPLLADGRVLLVRQFRYPVGEEILELPAGRLHPGEDPRLAAARELEEETGWKAARWEKLAAIFTTPGFCSEVLHLFLATELAPLPGGPRREEGEQGMSVHMLPFREALRMAETGLIRDGKTLAGLLLAERRMQRKEG